MHESALIVAVVTLKSTRFENNQSRIDGGAHEEASE
jgi:hypothetical protein